MVGPVGWGKITADKFAWTGFVLVPLFLLLEVLLKYFVALFGGDRNAARFTLASALVAARRVSPMCEASPSSRGRLRPSSTGSQSTMTTRA